jgi:hypothetical protein
MEEFALLVTGLVLCLTIAAIVAQLLRWRKMHRDDRERAGREVHDDPRWRKWAEQARDHKDEQRGPGR